VNGSGFHTGAQHGRCCGSRIGRKNFFFEKKKQKTFIYWLRAAGRSEPKVKSFLLLFFKKEDRASLLNVIYPIQTFPKPTIPKCFDARWPHGFLRPRRRGRLPGMAWIFQFCSRAGGNFPHSC
jgi:hypothetical protein